MEKTQLTLLIVVTIMVIFTLPTARKSKNRQKIYGGARAEIFHMIGVAAYLGVLPAALCGSILVGPLEFGIPLMLVLLATSFVSLLVYAFLERPYRTTVTTVDRGWTAEDARKSGL